MRKRRNNCITVGCDLHDRSMLLRIALNEEEPETRTFMTDRVGREKMIAELKQRAKEAGGARIVFAYEACALGYGLHDDLTERGIECYVLAPTRLPHSAHSRKSKCDVRDAQMILEVLRGHVLAGNELPAVWVPDHKTREDRDLLRSRMDIVDKLVCVRTQIRTLLKRWRVEKREDTGKGWTQRYVRWLKGLTAEDSPLPPLTRTALHTLLRQMELLVKEQQTLDGEVYVLAHTERYEAMVLELLRMKGVGLLTAMTFLTEMGDLHRFKNRRKVAGYLGVVPSSDDTGETVNRKGHITKQGPPRVRKVLCQAAWSCVKYDEGEKAQYNQIVKRNPEHKKIALVAIMRRLAVRMWHRALAAQSQSSQAPEAPPLPSPSKGGEAPVFTKVRKNGATPKKTRAPRVPPMPASLR